MKKIGNYWTVKTHKLVKDRPKNLNLLTIHQPLPAIASILHRASGMILFLAIPFLLWGLYLSLSSEQAFDDLHQTFSGPCVKLLIWAILSAFIYHFIAGIRHLLMDVHIGEGLKGGRLSALITVVLAGVLILITGIWLW